jgi:MOSC domain-containing protein YiiM
MATPPNQPVPVLLSLRAGRSAPYGPEGQPSAIVKLALAGRARLGPEGLAADQQADRVNHGGPDKALHHYPFDHYDTWRTELPDAVGLLHAAGAFGENLSTLGMTEADVCLGDVYRLGSARVQVSQGRQPCWKLNQRFGRTDMVERVLNSGRTGWYYRVIEAGEIGTGDRFELIERPCPDWPLARLWQVLFGPGREAAALATLSRHDLLAESWRARARKRLGE